MQPRKREWGRDLIAADPELVARGVDSPGHEGNGAKRHPAYHGGGWPRLDPAAPEPERDDQSALQQQQKSQEGGGIDGYSCGEPVKDPGAAAGAAQGVPERRQVDERRAGLKRVWPRLLRVVNEKRRDRRQQRRRESCHSVAKQFAAREVGEADRHGPPEESPGAGLLGAVPKVQGEEPHAEVLEGRARWVCPDLLQKWGQEGSAGGVQLRELVQPQALLAEVQEAEDAAHQ